MSFFMPFCGEAMHMRNMGMSFFGMLLYILDICPENRDESNGNNIVKLWLQFIPIFGALHSQLCKGHTKKRHLHVPCKKRHLHAKQKVSFTSNPEAERRGYLPRLQEATASVPTFCGRDYGRDVVPLNRAVREANRRN